jgi:predicted MFS family arabinose efflux permease
MPLCGLEYAMLVLAPNNPPVVLGSAVVFGAASITPGTGFLVWGMSLFNQRPSIGSGTVFFFLTIGTVTGPLLFGSIAPRAGVVAVFLVLAALSVLVLPFFPPRIFATSAPGSSEFPANS